MRLNVSGTASVGMNPDPNDVPFEIDWGLVTLALGGRELYPTRGRTLGGRFAVIHSSYDGGCYVPVTT